MLPEGAIRCDHVWKRFRADRKRNRVLDELGRAKAKLTRQPAGPRHRWALRDIDFEVAPGESLGLVGSNGSGKSTLLKMLNQVMYPYAGRVEAEGRIGALIEVTAGIHPLLSGRENAYLYGSLLGMPRKEVALRFDEIVAFAELEGAVDRLVKFYSSGMKMRLGFAVAAILSPSILLVDEVLAVGDASFQQRCLDRMRDVLAEGATLVFVSHDLAAVEATCSRGIWIEEGIQRIDGPIADTLHAYRNHVESLAHSVPLREGPLQLTRVEVNGVDGAAIATQGPVRIDMTFEGEETGRVKLYVGVSEGTAIPVFSLRKDLALEPGTSVVACDIERLPLPRGDYSVWVAVTGRGDRQIMPWHPVAQIAVSGPDLDRPPKGIVRPSPVHVEASWSVAGVGAVEP
jgi:ABC-2 type transport system ATP-binding protein